MEGTAPLPDAALATAMVASSPLATIVLDEARVVIVFNPAAERLTGRSAGDVLGQPAATLFPASEAVRSLEQLEAAARGRGHHIESVLRTEADGRVRVGFSWAPLWHEGERRGLIGVGRDIARRKRLEHELRRMADSFRVLAEDTDLGLYRFSFLPDVKVDFVNGCLERMIGYRSTELAVDPSPLWERLDPAAATALGRSRKGEDVAWPLDATWQHPDGRVLDLQFREASLHDVGGRLEAVVGIVRDVTAQRQQERALASTLDLERVAADELRRVDELRKIFLQAVSHELRTPLTAVLGFSATLRDRIDDLPPGRAATLTDRLHRQATRMQRLLDDLLDVDRLSRGVLDLQRTSVDLGELVQRVADEVDVGLEVDAPSCVLAVDAQQIERTLVNLIVNARRHAGPMAAVRVSLDPGDPTRDEPVRLVVEDDGPGVPDALRHSVFEPFAQGHSAEGSPSPGTGIGLTLVAAFAALHGGSAAVDTSPLGGARFTVELPREPAPDPTEPTDL